MKNILRSSNFGFTKWCVGMALLRSEPRKLNRSFGGLRLSLALALTVGWIGAAQGQTPYLMSTGNKTWDFADMANWTANFASGTDAANWGSVGIIGTGTSVTSGTRTTKSSATFASTGTSGGLHKGTQAMVFLSSGSTSTPEAVAVDLFLNFTGRNAGTLSFNWAALDNSSGTRPTSLRVFWSTDGTSFTELTSAQVLDQVSSASGSISAVNLPANFNNSATARLRFYNHAGSTTVGSGNRDKMQIDNVAVTSTATGSAPDVTSFSPAIGKTGTQVTITGLNFGSSTPTVSFNGTAATVSSSTSTSILVTVPEGATTGKISVTAGGLTAQSLTDFTVDNIAPLVSSTSPVDDTSNTAPGSLKITFNEGIAKGTGNIRIKKTSDDSVVETIAVSATQVTASGSVLTIKPTTSLAYSTGYYVEYDAGIVSDLAGNSLATGSTGNTAWNFTTKAESPVIITQYYEGVSNNKFIEIANIGGTSLALTGYSLVLWGNTDAEGWKNTNTYVPGVGSILDLSGVTLAPGQVYVVANSGAALPFPAANANITSNITYFNGNDSVVLHYTGGGLTINDPASVVDAVSFTNIGNEGLDKTFSRISKAPGYSLDAGSNITQFTDVWQQSVDLATANGAASGTDAYLGSTSLATPPALVAFSSGSVTVNEDGGTANLTVVLSANAVAQVTAEVALDSSSTVTTADIGNFATQTVTFPAGSAAGSTQTVAVTITDDSEAELSEKAVFKIQNIVGNAVAGAPVTSTINIRPSDNTIANLLISEVPDPSNGSGNYRYIELYNPGATDVDLATGQWNLVRYSNGGTSAQAIPLTGTVRAGGTFVIASSASFSIGYPAAALPEQTSSQINGNGDDVYTLYFGGDNTQGLLRDIYGIVGEQGAGTWGYAGKRAVRKSSVVAPNPVWTASEWVVASAASAKMTPGAHPDTAPVITSTLTASAIAGTAFEYQIAANNNPTVYSAVGLPTQLQFNATTGLIIGTPATAETLSVTIEATNGGGTDSKTLVIAVGAANSAPTEIGLTATSIAENNAVNAVVGTLSTTDVDSGDTFTYSLVAGTGGDDNGSFNINGNQLRAAGSLNFEVKSSYTVLVQVTDSGGSTYSKPFTITVTNVNETPANIGLTAISIAENNVVNAVVGTLSTTDVDSGDTFTYSLVAGAGSTDNALFNISGSSLQAGVVFDFETPPTNYSIRVQTTDSANNTFEKVFTITVTDVVEGSTYRSWLGTADPSDAAFLDYVFGAVTPGTLDPSLKPTVAIVPPTVGSGVNTATLVLTYYVRQNTVGLKVTPKTSTDLAAAPGNWTTVTDDEAVGSSITRGDGVTVQMRKASVLMIGDRQFLRAEAVQQ